MDQFPKRGTFFVYVNLSCKAVNQWESKEQGKDRSVPNVDSATPF